MTHDTWLAIDRYVTDRLATEADFQIDVHDFEKLFGLEKPFYEEMIRHAQEERPAFAFHAPWKEGFSQEAAWMIHFSRK